jgi:hypothetical protein
VGFLPLIVSDDQLTVPSRLPLSAGLRPGLDRPPHQLSEGLFGAPLLFSWRNLGENQIDSDFVGDP